MKRLFGVFSLIAAASLAACGPSGGIASASSLPAPTAPSTSETRATTAADVATVAGNVVVKADAALSIAEKAYAGARYLAQLAIASGYVSPSTAATLKLLDEEASTALFFGRTATDKAGQATAAAKLLVITGQVEKAAPTP